MRNLKNLKKWVSKSIKTLKMKIKIYNKHNNNHHHRKDNSPLKLFQNLNLNQLLLQQVVNFLNNNQILPAQILVNLVEGF